MTNIYFDENLPPSVARALSCLCENHYSAFCPKSTVDDFGSGTADEVLIPEIGKSGGILVTQDINMRKRAHQYELCSNHNLGMFFVQLPKNSNRYWEIVKLLVFRWEEIISIVNKRTPPFAYEIKPKGKIKELR